MKELLVIAISSAFVSNVVLSQFLGICSFVGVSKKVETAAGMGGAVIFVITIASVVASLIYQFVLNPLGLDYLKTIVFILVIAALVQIVEMFLKKCMVSLYNALGVFLPQLFPGSSSRIATSFSSTSTLNFSPKSPRPIPTMIPATAITAAEKKVAFVRCKGTCDKVKTLYNYEGIDDCAKASVVPAGGPKACSYGCTGFGSCVKACQFDAIHVVDGVAVVDKEKCVACGKCVATCPKGLIQIVPYSAEHFCNFLCISGYDNHPLRKTEMAATALPCY